MHAEHTSMLRSVHAIWGSASAPVEHQRRRPRTAGDRAGKQNRQFISALVERFAASATSFCTSSPCMSERSPGRVTTAGAVALTRLWQTVQLTS
jgi:hypothetical protein